MGTRESVDRQRWLDNIKAKLAQMGYLKVALRSNGVSPAELVKKIDASKYSARINGLTMEFARKH